MKIIEIDISEEVKSKCKHEPPQRIVKTPNIQEVAKKIEQQYLYARTLPESIKKPLSYAIYKVWEEYNRHEKEGEYSCKY